MCPDAYWKAAGKWWDDYNRHSAVVWDEFTGGSYPYRELLRILDSTPLILEAKGTHHQFIADIVVFTSNFHPRDWYNLNNIGHDTWETSPLYRRLRDFGQIIDLTPPPPPPQACIYCANGICAFHHL